MSQEPPPIQDVHTLSPPRWGIAVPLLIGITVLVLHLTNPNINFYYGAWESAVYVKSVDHPLEAPVDSYYGYVLLPALVVRLLPVGHPLGFALIDYLCLFGAAYLLYKILLHEKINPRLSLLCSILFLSFPCSTKWLLAYSPGPDAVHVFLIAAAYRCIQLQQWWLFSFVLLLGTFNKVTIWLLWPVALLYHMQTRPGKSWSLGLRRSSVGTILPAILAFVIIRRIWPPAIGTYHKYLHIIKTRLYWKLFVDSAMVPGLPQIIEFPMSFFIVFGMVGLIIVFHLRRSFRILAAHPAMFLFLVGSMALSFCASEDSERCWPYAAVPVLYLFATVIQEQWAFYKQWRVAVPLLIGQAFLSDFFLWDVDYYPGYMAHYMLPECALAYLLAFSSGAALLVILRYGSKPPGLPGAEGTT